MRPYYDDNPGQFEQRPYTFGFAGSLWTPAVKYLILANVLAFIAQMILENLGRSDIAGFLSLVPPLALKGWAWQFITYAFLHASVMHILFNMLFLWMFGVEVERALGTARFTVLYLLSGIAAGLSSALLDYAHPVIGASGCVLGVLIAFGMMFPSRVILLFFIFPMPARVAVMLIAAIEVLNAATGTGGLNVACFAHLGGMAFGYLFVKTRPSWEEFVGRIARPRQQMVDDDDDVSPEDEVEMDRLLRKIKRDGMQTLTWREKRFLDGISRRLRKQ